MTGKEYPNPRRGRILFFIDKETLSEDGTRQ